MPKKNTQKSKKAVKKESLSSGVVSMFRNLHQRLTAVEPVHVDIKDVKTSVPKQIGKRGSLHEKAENMRLTLTQKFTNATSAASTLQAPTYTLTPGTSNEFASIAALYDDWRTTHVELFCAAACVVQATGAPAVVALPLVGWGYVYDPIDNTALVGVSDAMDYDHRVGPLKYGYDGVNNPNALTKSGFYDLKLKIPAPVVDPGILSDLLDSNWVSTKDTSVIVGYLKGVIEATGGVTASVFGGYARYTCEFRSRK